MKLSTRQIAYIRQARKARKKRKNLPTQIRRVTRRLLQRLRCTQLIHLLPR